MVGDVTDIVGRLRAVLPKGWFSDQAHNLTALLKALATPWAWLHELIQYVATQSRLATATGSWLDIYALDYFGSYLTRRTSESDVSLRNRIEQTLFQEAGTRAALISTLTLLTGSPPKVFEPARCADTGAYGSPTTLASSVAPPFAYGHAGGWGSLCMPYQFFISAVRPPTPGIANLSGYTYPFGGYGAGQLSYASFDDLPGAISDSDIERQICRLLPVNATAWLQII